MAKFSILFLSFILVAAALGSETPAKKGETADLETAANVVHGHGHGWGWSPPKHHGWGWSNPGSAHGWGWSGHGGFAYGVNQVHGGGWGWGGHSNVHHTQTIGWAQPVHHGWGWHGGNGGGF